MSIEEMLNDLKNLAKQDDALAARLIATEASDNQLTDFCAIAVECGIPISPMDMLTAGEAAYAAIRRSTNGGGENSPLLAGEDDYYELFMADLKRVTGAREAQSAE